MVDQEFFMEYGIYRKYHEYYTICYFFKFYFTKLYNCTCRLEITAKVPTNDNEIYSE